MPDQVPGRHTPGSGSRIADRYDLVRLLGKGAMGAVYEASDTSLGETVALKMLFAQHLDDEISVSRFRNEVSVARKLAHPNIVRIYDFGRTTDGVYYLTMEYLKGGSLAKWIKRKENRELDLNRAIDFISEIASAVAYAHANGIVHRDLKPENILLDEDGHAKVTDFGLARDIVGSQGLTATGELLGTPYYMSPEQLTSSRKIDGRADIYALGIIAYELVVGRPPFYAETFVDLAAMHLDREIPHFATRQSGIPKWYENFVRLCCEKDPHDRFQSGEEIADFLRSHHASRLDTTVSRPSAILSLYRSEQRTRRRRRTVTRRVVNAVAGTATFLAGLTTFLVLGSRVPQWAPSIVGFIREAENATDFNLSAVRKLLGMGFLDSDREFASALTNGDTRRAALFLANGADPNRPIAGGKSPAELAVERDDPALLSLLVRAGADLSRRFDGGATLLHRAAALNKPQVIKVLASLIGVGGTDADSRTPLMSAATMGSAEAAEALLERIEQGENPEQRDAEDKKGMTSLHIAAQNRFDRVVRVLLEHRANVNKTDVDGRTALHYAAEQPNQLVIKLLLDAGADTAIKDKWRKTARDTATGTNRSYLEDALKARASAAASSAPITAYALPTKRVVDANAAVLTVKVKNTGATPLTDLAVLLISPSGVSQQFEPKGSLQPGQEGEFALRIKLAPGEQDVAGDVVIRSPELRETYKVKRP